MDDGRRQEEARDSENVLLLCHQERVAIAGCKRSNHALTPHTVPPTTQIMLPFRVLPPSLQEMSPQLRSSYPMENLHPAAEYRRQEKE